MSTIIAVDPGKFDVKSKVLIDGVTSSAASLESKVYTLSESEEYSIGGTSVFIDYDGQRYILGEQGKDRDLKLTKDTMLHKLGTMAALSTLVPNYSGDINLILGCPATLYKNKEQRKAYKDFITDGGILSFKDENRSYMYDFKKILVLPESGGAPYLYPKLFAGKRVGVIDLGGLNLNWSVYNNLVLDLESLSTDNYGGFEIERRIKTEFSAKFGIPITDDDVRFIRSNGGLSMRGEILPDSILLLEEIYDAFVKQIPEKIRAFGYNVDTMDIVCIGGTSNLVRKYIQRYIPHANVLDNTAWVNAEGFLEVGKMKYSNKK